MPYRKLLIALVGSLTILWTLGSTSAPPATPNRVFDPAPRNSDGRFENWAGELGHGTAGTRIPFFFRRMGGLFHSRPGAPTRIDNDGIAVRRSNEAGDTTVTWVGHATLLVQIDHVNFLTDPIWSSSPSPISFLGPRRFVPPGIEIEDLPRIDFVVVSHNHYDHLDLPTLRALADRDPNTRFLVPLGNAELLRDNGIERVEEFDWGDQTQHEDLTIHCLPSQHWSKRGIGDDQKALWAAWAVTGRDKRFFFSGDTGYFPGFAKVGEALGPFDLAAVPIGAYEPTDMMKYSHMNPEEAVQAALDLRAANAIAMHFGTFDLSDEPLDEPPRRFMDAAVATSLGTESAWVFQVGETRHF